jgi:hypothetical protein
VTQNFEMMRFHAGAKKDAVSIYDTDGPKACSGATVVQQSINNNRSREANQSTSRHCKRAEGHRLFDVVHWSEHDNLGWLFHVVVDAKVNADSRKTPLCVNGYVHPCFA